MHKRFFIYLCFFNTQQEKKKLWRFQLWRDKKWLNGILLLGGHSYQIGWQCFRKNKPQRKFRRLHASFAIFVVLYETWNSVNNKFFFSEFHDLFSIKKLQQWNHAILSYHNYLWKDVHLKTPNSIQSPDLLQPNLICSKISISRKLNVYNIRSFKSVSLIKCNQL